MIIFSNSRAIATTAAILISAAASTLMAQNAKNPASKPDIKKQPTTAEEKKVPAPPVNEFNVISKIKKIDKNTVQIGKVIISKKDRTISFPAESEITSEIVECAVVTAAGRIHESLFVTETKPIDLNLGFKLLGFKENKSIFHVFKNGSPTLEFQKSPEDHIKKSFFTIHVSWTDDKTKKIITKNINELFGGAYKKIPAAERATQQWSYGGSFFHKGQFAAGLTHDLISIFVERAAVGNYSGKYKENASVKGNQNEIKWAAIRKAMPKKGTHVTIIIKPELKNSK